MSKCHSILMILPEHHFQRQEPGLHEPLISQVQLILGYDSFLQGLIPWSFFISFSFSFLPALLVTHCFNYLFLSARLPTPLTCSVIRAPHLLWQGCRKGIPSVTSLDRIHCSNLFRWCVCGDRRSVNCIAWVVCTWNCPPLIPDYGIYLPLMFSYSVYLPLMFILNSLQDFQEYHSLGTYLETNL